MKAIVFPKYGSPDVLQFIDKDKPTPKETGVTIKVHAASANPLDWHRMRGAPFLVRLSDGVLKPKDTRIGADVAGVVETVGSGVTEFKVGDAVFGVCTGSFAEYVNANHKFITHKPANISFEQAAATPVAALTALQGLRDNGKIQAGQKVLVNGASGGVGSFAVQIAKSYGAEVTGVCSTRNLDMVRSMGADQVIDYTKEDFTKKGQQYDLIYDAIGNRSVGDYKRALTPNGMCVIAGFTTLPRVFEHIVVGGWVSRRGSQKIGLMGVSQPNKEDMVALKGLLETGKIKPVIDRRYPLSETAEAIRYIETLHARGKVIINVA